MMDCLILGKTALIYSVVTLYLGLRPRIKKSWSKKSTKARGCNLGPKFPPHAVHLSEKNDDIAVQYEDVRDLINYCDMFCFRPDAMPTTSLSARSNNCT